MAALEQAGSGLKWRRLLFCRQAHLKDLVGAYRIHEAYDLKTNSWDRLPPMPTPRHGLAVGDIGGKIYAISGSNVAGGGGPHTGVNVNEMYEPAK